MCGVGTRFTSIPRQMRRYIESEIKVLNKNALSVFNERVSEFDAYAYYNRVKDFITNTHFFLLNSFFGNRMKTADVMRRKMNLNVAYEDLTKHLNATQSFDHLAKDVENQIILMNKNIGEVYHQLKIL